MPLIQPSPLLRHHTAVGPRRAASALAALLALSGCGGSDDPSSASPNPPAGPVAVAPVVTATSPAASEPMPTDVDIHTALSATFSKDMMPSSITPTNFAVACPARQLMAARVTYDAATRTATLTPDPALPEGTVCEARVDTAVLDTTRIALTSAYVWRFVTASSR